MNEGNDPHDGTGQHLSHLGTQQSGMRKKQLCERDPSVLHGRPAVSPGTTRRVGVALEGSTLAAGEGWTTDPVAAGTRDPDSGRQGVEQ